MDVIFETRGKQFTIEVGFFDTVLEMKEKIQKYEGFPVSRQTLIFNGQVMVDERDTEFYEVLQWSKIQLQVEPDQEEQQKNGQQSSGNKQVMNNLKVEDSSSTTSSTTSSSSSKNKVQLLVKIPMSKRQFSIGVDGNGTVRNLKERIQEVESIPVSHFVLFLSGNELMENRTLVDYGIVDRSEVSVVVRVPFAHPIAMPAASGGGSGGGGGGVGAKKLKIMVLPKSGTQKIEMEVNPMDNVGELKKELQKMHQFQLPAEGYFFIYKQSVMDDDRSFRSHEVRQGDTIEIFNGSVTGGS